jgi:uncharacterized protein with PIN domain
MQISSQPQREVSALFGKVMENDNGVRDLDLFIAKARMTSSPWTKNRPISQPKAFRRYGKGRHPAALNFGYCFANARPHRHSVPSSEFRLTDLTSVSYRLSAPLNNSSSDTPSFTASAERINTVGLYEPLSKRPTTLV